MFKRTVNNAWLTKQINLTFIRLEDLCICSHVAQKNILSMTIYHDM